LACRVVCGATTGGIVPLAFRVPLPASVTAPAKQPRVLELYRQSAESSPAPPRAPPLS
jgi:hypothetical protein